MTLPLVVTGISSGIGERTAALLRERGARVIGVDRNPPPSDLEGFVQADLGTPDGVAAAVRSVSDLAGGPLAAVVNVAGVPGTAPWRTVISVNVLGLRDLTEGLAAQITEGGAVVHLASSVAEGWRENLPAICRIALAKDWRTALDDVAAEPDLVGNAYRFSKECVRFLTERGAAGLLDRSIRVVSVSPGPVETPILEDFKSDHGREKVEAAARAVGRFGRPEDVASVIAFLLEPAASWINGTDIRVDGGLGAYRAHSAEPAAIPHGD
ncbi:coniferyl-alcohol dehydrogenase [Blastococcus mobilis]|uniref:NAD(P)-dependent dehydrogenase, short-chain alcohol dehydrogenase family n=1 Tax=Blastococcus mobilis TaxID=1938746 RepID=A0A239AK68_9ACTN|nr:coniferyl-alcohol dehydrogenase [Blastococcus mobilis]SNR95771.1 NAD(P)-dependent dehydrogenase, short-chain alcohol dehydrogenase family [Blastococcus mobilis]